MEGREAPPRLSGCGTEAAALFDSLIESAKLCGVEPTVYRLQAVRAVPATPSRVTLPHALAG